MILFMLYVCIAAMAAAGFRRIKKFVGWSRDSIAAATFFFGLVWPLTVPAGICYTLMMKLLDKFLKV